MDNKYLGHSGKLLSGSKGRYKHDNPDHLVIFNADVTLGGEKVWYGDLDLTSSKTIDKLTVMANKEDKLVSVYYEREAKKELPILSISPEGDIYLNEKLLAYYTFTDEGTFKLKPEHLPKPFNEEELISELHTYKDVIFSDYIELPEISSFESEECPYIPFYAYIAEKLNVELNELHCSDVFVSKSTAEKLNKLVLDHIKQELGDDEYTLEKEYGIVHLCYSPNVGQVPDTVAAIRGRNDE